MSFFTNLRADRLIAEIKAAEDSDSHKSSLEKLVRLGASAIPRILDALASADNRETAGFVAVLTALLDNKSFPAVASGLTQGNQRTVAGAATALSNSRNYPANLLFGLLDQPAMPKGTVVGINLLGVVWGCRTVLPVMKRQGSGLIFNIASSAGFAAAPQMSAYNATKAGVIALSETLASELAGTGLQVSCAMPGFFRTHLLDHMRAPPEENRLAHRIMDNSGHDPDEAALALLGAAAAGELYVVWPPEYRWAWRLKRWFPRWFLKRVQSFRDAQARKAGRPPG